MLLTMINLKMVIIMLRQLGILNNYLKYVTTLILMVFRLLIVNVIILMVEVEVEADFDLLTV